jgi:hypothetical protein
MRGQGRGPIGRLSAVCGRCCGRHLGARNVITADRGDEPATEEGDVAVAIEFNGGAVVS